MTLCPGRLLLYGFSFLHHGSVHNDQQDIRTQPCKRTCQADPCISHQSGQTESRRYSQDQFRDTGGKGRAAVPMLMHRRTDHKEQSHQKIERGYRKEISVGIVDDAVRGRIDKHGYHQAAPSDNENPQQDVHHLRLNQGSLHAASDPVPSARAVILSHVSGNGDSEGHY